ncbi:MAG: hypothetical protein AAGK98_03730 [Pseudomonadota bacterium]
MRRLQQGLDGLARLRNAVPPRPMKPSSVTGREPVKGTREADTLEIDLAIYPGQKHHHVLQVERLSRCSSRP